MKTCFTNARILLTHESITGWLLVEDDIIRAFGTDTPPDADQIIDANNHILAPGFIDIHVHGAVGHDTMDADDNGLRQMAKFFAEQGVTSFLPTTWTAPRKAILASMQAIKTLQNQPIDGATIIGAHMEGPYLNQAYTGAQNPEYIRTANRDEMNTLFDLDVIRLLALAPEFEENHWLIKDASERGVQVSVAHSGATYEQITHAFELGLSHSTHTFNAMTGLHHRKPGIVGAVMTNDDVYCELIADGIHVHPIAMQTLWRMKQPNKLVLITDAIRASGMPDGEYPVDERIMTVKDGKCTLEDGTLAGSIATMTQVIRIFVDAIQQPFTDFWQATSLNPANAIGVADKRGSIEVGKYADLVLLDDTINIALTMTQGRIVYQQEGNNVIK